MAKSRAKTEPKVRFGDRLESVSVFMEGDHQMLSLEFSRPKRVKNYVKLFEAPPGVVIDMNVSRYVGRTVITYQSEAERTAIEFSEGGRLAIE